MELGLYGSTREFIREITSEFIKHKIEFYKKQLKLFEKKYGMSFSAFSKKLENSASIPEEDDWMEWEAAENMIGVWKSGNMQHPDSEDTHIISQKMIQNLS